MAYFFIKARNIHHTLHMGFQSVRHHVNVIKMKNNRPFYVTQSPNNSLSDVIRMHSHISKSSNYKCILSDKIVHLIVVADYLGAIGIFTFNRFRMSMQHYQLCAFSVCW